AGKLASCAAMALTVGSYAVPASPGGARVLAILAVTLVAAINLGGVEKTARATRAIVVAVVAALALAVVAIAAGGEADSARARPEPGSLSARGTLEAAGFLFFAFAGYARIAPLGEEVRDPARTIPRAISTALALVLLLYAVVLAAALAALPADALAASA